MADTERRVPEYPVCETHGLAVAPWSRCPRCPPRETDGGRGVDWCRSCGEPLPAALVYGDGVCVFCR